MGTAPTTWLPSNTRYRVGTQKRQIIDYLLKGHRLSSADAMIWFRCARLASRINELRRDGWTIISREVHVGDKRFASYHLSAGFLRDYRS